MFYKNTALKTKNTPWTALKTPFTGHIRIFNSP